MANSLLAIDDCDMGHQLNEVDAVRAARISRRLRREVVKEKRCDFPGRENIEKPLLGQENNAAILACAKQGSHKI
jgi:hypothetical protein